MDANDLMNCFKMKVDMNGIKKLEEYISKLEQENEELKKQQQEFIKYLEVERERCLTFYCRTECAYAYDAFKGVLAKYKSIIGVEDEK